MAHKQLLFNSAAREKVLRGATALVVHVQQQPDHEQHRGGESEKRCALCPEIS